MATDTVIYSFSIHSVRHRGVFARNDRNTCDLEPIGAWAGFSWDIFVFFGHASSILALIPLSYDSGGGLKLGMVMKNWNWDNASQSAGLDTFLGISYQMWAHPPNGATLNFSQGAETINFGLDVGGFPFKINMDKGVIFDGQPSIVGTARLQYSVPLPPIQDLWYALEFNQGFCTSIDYPFERHQNITYDPSIVSLFSTDPTVPRSKSSKTVGIAVGVSIGVIALIVAVIVVLVLTVPSVREFVRPYSKNRTGDGQRKPLQAETHSTSKEWSPASKPRAE